MMRSRISGAHVMSSWLAKDSLQKFQYMVTSTSGDFTKSLAVHVGEHFLVEVIHYIKSINQDEESSKMYKAFLVTPA